MKVSDILESQRTDEAPPVGMMSRAGQIIGSKIPRFVDQLPGLGARTMQLRANNDIGARANKIYQRFQQWQMRLPADKQIDMQAVTTQDLTDFFNFEKLDVPSTWKKPQYDFTNQQEITDFFTNLARATLQQNRAVPMGQRYGSAAAAAAPAAGTGGASPEDQIKSLWGGLGANEKNALRLWLQANP